MKKNYCLLLSFIIGLLNCSIIFAQDYCKGMDRSNMMYKMSGDIVTFMWTPVDGDNVKIDLFEPEEGMYKNLGTVRMSEGKFDYKIKWNGEHNFSFSNGLNGCNGLDYKIDLNIKTNMDLIGIEMITGYNNFTDKISNESMEREKGEKVLNNGYPRELNDAYEFAYKNGITTMGTIEKAKMNSSLTRIAMAKMLSNYAINVLGKKPTSPNIPIFTDVTNELDKQYGNGVTLAYQLGIMGINMKNNKFRPYDEVTRVEFGTALSRMLYGLNDGNLYYSTHLDKLKKEKIISNDNPNLKEKRGYVMLMLMRSAK